MLATPIKTTHNIRQEIAQQGYSLVTAEEIPLSEEMQSGWEAIRAEYASLPADNFLPGGGKYRSRRYDSFYFQPETGELRLLPHRNYFQDTDINAVTGGIVRTFEPLTPETIVNPFLRELIRFDFANFPLRDSEQRYGTWQVDVHQIHVVAQPEEISHPTPEGVHRDGAAFVTVHLAQLENADGGLVTVYDDDKQPLESFQLHHILDSYLFEDAILWHGVTPITSRDGVNPAQRGILTFDYHYKPELQRPE
ncbi:2OG-Fe dioxygenase family protein [Phototrophicus methaneseepsis]|uniref:2OG-Fe dioxygenase family protein n=1 Tax=Phototrophicus methaneseepsis TaxID=2710758 RepID=A0A7S8E8L7_9CHLR|nr:2OG-Fe dioxygenase family protein [Phototrophicus methaneseepsis]QPC82352.1 2OG-Fe dioxygenase family protein [Phototrophicus methaneseepsis]